MYVQQSQATLMEADYNIALINHCHVIGENWKIGRGASEEISSIIFLFIPLCAKQS